jgi:hypothetical protein
MAKRRFATVHGHRPDRFRPVWEVEFPDGRRVDVELDRIRSLWRVSPGEYIRRELVNALSQASGAEPSTPWLEALVADIERSKESMEERGA